METIDLDKQGEKLIFFPPYEQKDQKIDFEAHMAPGAEGPPPHLHPKQDEGFYIKSGELHLTVDGNELILKKDEQYVVKAGQVHTFKNNSDTEPVLIQIFVDPAMNFYWFLSESAKSAVRGGGSWRDASLIESGYIVYQVRDHYRMAGIPYILQDILFWMLAMSARLTGISRRITPKPD